MIYIEGWGGNLMSLLFSIQVQMDAQRQSVGDKITFEVYFWEKQNNTCQNHTPQWNPSSIVMN